jgi:RND family efflux transporter MFP subunit
VHKRAGKITLIVLVILVAILAAGCNEKKEVEKETEITVATAAAAVQEIAKSSTYSGIVRGQNEVYITPKVAARVIGIYAVPGDRVSQGQTLIMLDSSDFTASVQQVQAGQQLAEISLDNARDNLVRIEDLYAAGAVSEKDYEAARNGVRSAEAAVEQAAAGLAQIMNSVNNCTITAPISGILGSINLSLGDMANPAAIAAIVSDTSRLEIEIMVSESDVSFITTGSEVEVKIKAVSEEVFTGTVASVAAVADPLKRSYAAKISLDNPDNKIKSGMFAEVKGSTVKKADVVCVPQSAIVPKGVSNVVFVVDADKRARERQVSTGIETETMVEVSEGVNSGEIVITKGNTLVRDGTLVRLADEGVL